MTNANIIQIYENKKKWLWIPNNDLAQRIQQTIPKLWMWIFTNFHLFICKQSDWLENSGLFVQASEQDKYITVSWKSEFLASELVVGSGDY